MRSADGPLDTWPTVTRQLGLTYRELALRTGVARDTVKSYATGRRVVPDGWLDKVSGVIEAERIARRDG